MPSTSSFPNGQLLQPSSLSLGQPLPSDSYISGKLALLWSLNPTDDHFRFCISAKYPLNTSDSDYITAQSKGFEKWRFVFHVAPSITGLKPGQTVRQALEAEHKEMEGVVGLDVKIALDGLKVIKLDGKEVELERTGSTVMWTEKRGKWTVFQGRSASKGPSDFRLMAFRNHSIINCTIVARVRVGPTPIDSFVRAHSTARWTIQSTPHQLSPTSSTQPKTDQQPYKAQEDCFARKASTSSGSQTACSCRIQTDYRLGTWQIRGIHSFD